MKEPASMDELVYFTKRAIGKGHATAWVRKQLCPKCKKAMMGKPMEKGKVKIRAKEYTCPHCKYTVEKGGYEDTLTAEIMYVCPSCQHKGEIAVPFKRKKVKVLDEETGKEAMADALVFNCEKCKHKIAVTKKMK